MGYYKAGMGGFGYYAGARGDPGFFSFLGGVARSFLGLPAPAQQPGPTVIQKIVKTAAPIISRGKAIAGSAVAVAKQHPVLTAAGAAATAAGGAVVAHAMGGSAAGAGMGAGGAMHAMRGGGRRRRMRVTNPKALRRAIRRTAGFARLAMKTIHLIHPRKKVRFGGFRMKRRKK